MRHFVKTFLLLLVVAAIGVASLRARTPQAPARGGGRGAAGQGAPAPPRPSGGAGPDDKPPVDAAAADRGRRVWASECITCHGTQARGTDTGPNLVRSVLVLHDRYGSEIGLFLKKGHKTQSGTPSANFTDAQIVDVANFLRQRINDSLRGSPIFEVQDILTGDAKAGADYFSGAGKCAACHTATANNLAGIATRVPNPVDVQQRMLFPGMARGGGGRASPAGGPAPPSPTAIMVTLTPATGASVSGVLVQMDDFYVTFRDATNTVHVVKRTPAMKVMKTDPLQAHHALLDQMTDKNMHDLVAYLETLK